jgi:hypothetical protein
MWGGTLALRFVTAYECVCVCVCMYICIDIDMFPSKPSQAYTYIHT